MTDDQRAIAVQQGSNLYRMRKMRGMSQEALAKALNITFQQVQKYESGDNRISLPTAEMICGVLGIEVGHLLSRSADEDTLKNSVAECLLKKLKRLRVESESVVEGAFNFRVVEAKHYTVEGTVLSNYLREFMEGKN